MAALDGALEVHVENLPELSAEEKKRPFAKYFYDEIPEPDPKVFQIMDKPCDPAKAITPEPMNGWPLRYETYIKMQANYGRLCN